MAIEFMHRGKKWRADTPEEAIALREKLEAEDAREAYQSDPVTAEELLYQQTKWTPDKFYELVQNIGPMQKRFLAVLLMSNRSVSAEEARKRTGVSSLMALAGVQSKLARQVRTLDLEPSDLYQVQIDWTEGERKRYFTLDRGFRLVAFDQEWPPENIRKEVGKDTNATSTKNKR